MPSPDIYLNPKQVRTNVSTRTYLGWKAVVIDKSEWESILKWSPCPTSSQNMHILDQVLPLSCLTLRNNASLRRKGKQCFPGAHLSIWLLTRDLTMTEILLSASSAWANISTYPRHGGHLSLWNVSLSFPQSCVQVLKTRMLAFLTSLTWYFVGVFSFWLSCDCLL